MNIFKFYYSDANRIFDPRKRTHMLSEDDYDYRENYKSKLKLFENFHSKNYNTNINHQKLFNKILF